MTRKVPLAALSRELTALTGRPAPSYRALWMKVVDGVLPAEQQPNGRYIADVNAVAEALGLTERGVA